MQRTKNRVFFFGLKLLLLSGILMGESAAAATKQSTAFTYSLSEQALSERPLSRRLGPKELAQRPNPNEDRFLSPEPELSPPLPEEDSDSELAAPEAEPLEMPVESEIPVETDDQIKVFVERIEIVGNSVLAPEDLASITQPLVGQEVTLFELEQAADAITQLYVTQGYLTSRAVLTRQEISAGVVQIQAMEGSLADIEIEGLERLRSGYVRSRLQRGTTTPLNANRVEEQLRLLSADPLLEDIRGRLEFSETQGGPVLSVEAQEADPWRLGLSLDNYSPPSLGSERLGASVAYQNLTGVGDTLSTSYYRSTTGGSSIWDFGYRVPVSAMDGALSLRAVFDENEVTQGPSAGLIDGETERYEISFRQPLIRTLKEEFALSVGFSYRDGQTFLGEVPFGFGIGPDPATGISRTSVFKFEQDYTRRDLQGAWALRSQFNIGTGLFDATNNDGNIPDGQFFSWLGQVQRVQRLGRDNLLIVKGDLQLTPNSLLSSEQFVIGGGQSLRGYRQNVRSGDNGFRFSVEDRITLNRNEATGVPVVQLAPFIDAGAIWNANDNPNQLGDQNFLAGAGLGVLYDPWESLSLRLDYALPLVEIDDEGDNAQDEGFYFSVNYQY